MFETLFVVVAAEGNVAILNEPIGVAISNPWHGEGKFLSSRSFDNTAQGFLLGRDNWFYDVRVMFKGGCLIELDVDWAYPGSLLFIGRRALAGMLGLSMTRCQMKYQCKAYCIAEDYVSSSCDSNS